MSKNEKCPVRDALKFQEGTYIKVMYAGDKYYDQAYIMLHPDYIDLVANSPGGYDTCLTMSKMHGTMISGPVSLVTALQNIRVGPQSCVNPMNESYIPSTIYTPIPTLWPMPPFKLKMQKALDAANDNMEPASPAPAPAYSQSGTPQVSNSSQPTQQEQAGTSSSTPPVENPYTPGPEEQPVKTEDEKKVAEIVQEADNSNEGQLKDLQKKVGMDIPKLTAPELAQISRGDMGPLEKRGIAIDDYKTAIKQLSPSYDPSKDPWVPLNSYEQIKSEYNSRRSG